MQEGWDVTSLESTHGVRLSFHNWPSNRLEATRIIAPIGAIYTPLARLPNTSAPPTALPYEPIRCSSVTCNAVLNPYCQVDFRSKLWVCPFCTNRNHFPSHYADNINEQNLPAELIPQFTTCEYELPSIPDAGSPAFIFCVDTCCHAEELSELADSISQALNLLPEDCLVGLITYGTNVQVHELGFEGLQKNYVLRGNKEYIPSKVQELLGCGMRHVVGRNAGAPAHKGAPPAPPAPAAPGPGMPQGSHQAQIQNQAQQNAYAGPGQHILKRFLLPVSECSLALESILEDLRKDPWPVPSDRRAARCTGCALSVATSILDLACARRGARIMLFTGGPCTSGPGAIVSRNKQADMRSHADLAKNAEPMHQPACEYYAKLAHRQGMGQGNAAAIAAAEKSKKKNELPMFTTPPMHVVDVFACSLDQVGMLEMRELVEATGGLMVLGDSFGQSVFKESLMRIFKRHPDDMPNDGGKMSMAFGASMEICTSREAKVQGVIGPVTSLNKRGSNVSEIEIGEGGTNAWALGGIDPGTSVAVYFEVAVLGTAPIAEGKRRYIQFLTKYQHSSGKTRLRSTTLCGPWHNMVQGEQQAQQNGQNGGADMGPDINPIKFSFDQEAAAVLTARLAVYRTETEDVGDVMRWIDRSLIRLCAKFADFAPDDPNSFRLSPQFSLFPQFMFHLRRSQFLQLFNSSPDEAAYYRYVMNRENTTNSLVMIQPTLLSYSFDGPPQPALLDSVSVQPNTILLLDTFFHVVVFHGETIAAWREAKYHEQEEHDAFRNLLEAPQTDAQMIMDSRFPVPRYIVCDQHKSEARFLMAKLNPSVSHNSEGGAGAAVFTDDVSLRVFMEHLMKLAVQS
uniref:Protein transport protein SEC23 n=1 Tax=Chaetoceros debilis TaxID=122233 RepID=A0A7S3VAU6_9STRA|mmetsp:Transcript_12841/g.19253  ORF Transcript_12841/g.19253 Transcript_12841/m.19253 type:complete len:853 (+) Transcript_12841:224-2782(+)|eukprot:CAMPEP_0194085962 /NCGR_PEP_ID=MMETSP0149-20130528/19420_1 /TAXON_ID=122233 /ORGANISM="Chaetoceros debilis, Strain MM31A-1" /LENGTH=852 /DNA_ID=CAMNT_0038768953 /DNA_START=169 /DNA_END=2727 /DNA_ORIENTATION=+